MKGLIQLLLVVFELLICAPDTQGRPECSAANLSFQGEWEAGCRADNTTQVRYRLLIDQSIVILTSLLSYWLYSLLIDQNFSNDRFDC